MGTEDDPHKDVVVVIDDTKMTMGAKEDHHPDHMVIDRVVSTFLGFSVWSVAYIILYSVGCVILYWDVMNKIGALLAVIPAIILVSCLLILWVHTFAVKLGKSCSMKPNPLVVLLEMLYNDTIEKNVGLRHMCILLCGSLHSLLVVGAQNAIHWKDPNQNQRDKWLLAFTLILMLVSYLHRKFTMIYMEEIITNHFEKIKQLRLQQQAAAAAAMLRGKHQQKSTTTTIMPPPKPS